MSTRLLCDLVAHAAAAGGIGLDDLLGPGRLPVLVRARQAVAVVAHRWGRPDHEIGTALRRERSVACYTRQRGERRLCCDPGFARLVARIEDSCARAQPLTPPDPALALSPAQREADAVQRAIREAGGLRARNRLIGAGGGEDTDGGGIDKGHRFHLGMIAGSRELARRITKARLRQNVAEEAL